MNIAKKALEQFCKDGKYIKVVEVSEAEVLFKGKDFDKAWEYATCVDEVFLEIHESAKKFIGFVHVLHEAGYEEDTVKDYSGNYVEGVIDNLYKLLEKREKCL
tara:strand:- start:256 stop:564 length:309 start_codon:yes stop_codon:yes gene_type:complete